MTSLLEYLPPAKMVKTRTTIVKTDKDDKSPSIVKVWEHISSLADERIVLLRELEVIQWLFGDTSFLPPIVTSNKSADCKKYKLLEDTWGQNMLRRRRPDLRLDKQWTNKFGEHICEELLILEGHTIKKPETISHYAPDHETEAGIEEAKAGTYFTSGTAGEKILGCPFKYAEVPELYGKPLRIVCMGGAEKVCREQYGNLHGAKCSAQKQRFLDFFAAKKITYIGATDILLKIVNC